MTILLKLPICLFAGYIAQAQVPTDPGYGALVEKGGAWAIVGILMWWILGKLSKQMDDQKDSTSALRESIDKLADKIERHS